MVVQTLAYAAFGLVDLVRTDHSVLAAAVSGLILFAGVGFWEKLILRGYVLPNAEAVAVREVVGVILRQSLAQDFVILAAVHRAGRTGHMPLHVLRENDAGRKHSEFKGPSWTILM